MGLRENLTNKQIINFLRHIKTEEGILAVKLINDELDRGNLLRNIFRKEKDGFGFFLSVKKMLDDKYMIKFGCQVEGTAGDGGKWVVSFDDMNKVIECEQESRWIS